MTPSISVVVPTFNRRDELARLLRAISRSTAAANTFEVIVVDDGSTDGTTSAEAPTNLDVQWITQSNGGPAAARNRGWRAARGSVVAFIDDDCVPEPDWVANLASAFDNPSVGGVGGRIVSMVNGRFERFVEAERLVDHGREPGRGTEHIKYLVTANAAYRREALERVSGFDEGFRSGEDVDLSYRIAAAGYILIEQPGAVVAHDHRTSLTSLLATYRKGGRARAALARRHRGLGVRTGAGNAMSWRRWREQVRRYRDGGASTLELPMFIALRFTGLLCFAYGVHEESSRRRRLRPKRTHGHRDPASTEPGADIGPTTYEDLT